MDRLSDHRDDQHHRENDQRGHKQPKVVSIHMEPPPSVP
jgi:hypothetical protein